MAANFPAVQPGTPRPDIALGHQLNTPGFQLDFVLRRISEELDALANKMGYTIGSLQTPAANTAMLSNGAGLSYWGTIGTATLQVGAVTVAYSTVGATGSPATASTSPVLMAEMSLAPTLTGNPILIMFEATTTQSGANANFLDITYDGTVMMRRTVNFPSAGYNVTAGVTVLLPSIAPGVHTIQGKFSVTAGTATGQGTERTLIVVELKR